jgi:HAD superfamily hydrolase (TIGR01549 family)
MIKAIIFDFDGVISNSVNVKTDAFAKLYEQYGDEVVNSVVEHHIVNGGMSRFEKFEIYHKKFLGIDLTKEELTILSEKFSSLVINKVVNAPYISGAYSFITNYFNKYQFFIISATPQNEMRAILQMKKIDSYFIKVLGSPAQKDYNIKLILNDFKLGVSEVCYIGDSINDYNAALSTGIKFIGLCSLNHNPFPTSVLTIDCFKSLINYIRPKKS